MLRIHNFFTLLYSVADILVLRNTRHFTITPKHGTRILKGKAVPHQVRRSIDIALNEIFPKKWKNTSLVLKEVQCQTDAIFMFWSTRSKWCISNVLLVRQLFLFEKTAWLLSVFYRQTWLGSRISLWSMKGHINELIGSGMILIVIIIASNWWAADSFCFWAYYHAQGTMPVTWCCRVLHVATAEGSAHLFNDPRSPFTKILASPFRVR